MLISQDMLISNMHVMIKSEERFWIFKLQYNLLLLEEAVNRTLLPFFDLFALISSISLIKCL
jgi:hypothetical protein